MTHLKPLYFVKNLSDNSNKPNSASGRKVLNCLQIQKMYEKNVAFFRVYGFGELEQWNGTEGLVLMHGSGHV